MSKTSQLFEALMMKQVMPDISKASHRQVLEQVADNLLKNRKYPTTKTKYFNKHQENLTKYNDMFVEHPKRDNELVSWKNYYHNKAYNKRIGLQRARDIAEGKTTPSIKQIYAQSEQEANRKNFRKQAVTVYDEANNQEELMRLMDDIDNTRSSYIADELNPDERMIDGVSKISKRSETSDEEALLNYINLISSAHNREPYALSRVKNAKEGSNLYKARELYKALYTSKSLSDKRRLQNIKGIAKRY